MDTSRLEIKPRELVRSQEGDRGGYLLYLDQTDRSVLQLLRVEFPEKTRKSAKGLISYTHATSCY